MDVKTIEPIEMISAPRLTDSPVTPDTVVLKRKIRGMRRKFRLVVAGSGFAAAMAAVAVLLTVGMLMDLWLTFGREARAILLGIDGIVFLWIVVRTFVRPILSIPDDDTLALMVECRQPQFRGRLISSIQLTRETTTSSPSLVRNLVAETTRLAERVDFSESITVTALARLAISTSLLAVIAIAGYAFGRPTSAALLGRVFLADTSLREQAVASAQTIGSPNSSPARVDGKSKKEAELKTQLDRELNDLNKIAQDEDNLKRDTEDLIQPKAATTN